MAHQCRDNNGDCSQICVPLWTKNFATALCQCTAGYKLRNRTDCVQLNNNKFLLYAKERLSSITGVSLNVLEVQQLLKRDEHTDAIVPLYNITRPLSIDINVHDKLIYFVVMKA